MKLYPLLFLDEAAKTAEEALAKRLALLDLTENSSDVFQKLILFIPYSLETAIKKTIEKEGPYNPTGWHGTIVKNAITKGKNQAIVANLTYDLKRTHPEINAISTSAAVGGYGPLIYQVAMYQHPDTWLASDTSLKPASKKIWNKMYELSNKGVYERKFLGEIEIRQLIIRSGIGRDTLLRYSDEVDEGKIPPTEKAFLDWLVYEDLSPEEFGYLWGYKKTQHDPKIEQLFDRGKKFVEDIETNYKIPVKETMEILRGAGTRFFSNLYGSRASYVDQAPVQNPTSRGKQ